MGPGGYKLLADALVIFHLCFIAFVVLGGLAALVRRWVMFLHLPCLAWGIYIELSHRICPLTPLEKYLRKNAGLTGYSGSFVDHYVRPVVYPRSAAHPHGVTDSIQLGIACGIIAINALAYAWITYSAYRRKKVARKSGGKSQVVQESGDRSQETVVG